MNRKFNIAAVLLAVLMMCMIPFKIYAANIPSLEDAKSDCIKRTGNITLSDFYYKFINVSNSDSSYVQFMFVSQDVADSNKNLLIYKYYYTDAYQLRFAKFENCEVVDINADSTRFGISYTSDGTWWNCVGNSGSAVISQSDFEKYFNSQIETNLPYFDSKESAENYFNTGDTSGLLNGDNFSSYDSSIEVPQNLKVDFSAAGLFDDKGRMNLCDFNISWNQSDNIDLSNYKTEIYMQPSVHFLKAPYIGQHWQSQLGKKVSVASVSTNIDNSYLITEKKLADYFVDATDEVTTEGVVDGSVAYFSEPLYIYVRNVVGNKYSDWIKVTVTPDNVTTEGTKIFNNGSGTVTSGYEQIKGDSSKGGGIGEAVGGSSASDSQYGKNYSIKVDDADLSSIAGHLKNGFGVLGDNGLIALLNTFFSFIPEDYFTVLVVFVSGCCAIGLLFLFLRR